MKPICEVCEGSGVALRTVGGMEVTMTCPEISNDKTYHGAEK